MLGWGSSIILVGLVVLLTIAAATSEPAIKLSCERVNVTSAEEGTVVAAAASDVVLKTEWLDQLKVPLSSRNLVKGQTTTDDGIVALELGADGWAPAANPSVASDFAIFESGEVIALLKVEQGEEDSQY